MDSSLLEKPLVTPSNPQWFLYIQKLFSPFGIDDSSVVVGYTLYEFAVKVNNYSFSYFIPLLVAQLGNQYFGDGKGSVIWGYITTVFAITTILAYLCFAPLMEYQSMRRQSLYACTFITGVIHILFLFCFSGGAVFIACILVIIAKTLQRVADVAFESLLNFIPCNMDVHQLSSRSGLNGYIGMLCFIPFALLIDLPLYLVAKVGTLWGESIIPLILIGIWYLFFTNISYQMVPTTIGVGPALPSPLLDRNVFRLLWFGGKTGLSEQYSSFLHLLNLPDLGMFILAYIFLAGGASTAISVGAILATDVLNISIMYIGLLLLIGILALVVGVAVFRTLNQRKLLSAKTILLINMIIFFLCSLYVLVIQSIVELVIFAIVAGFQTGSVAVFSRSIVSSLIPTVRQSRLFAFYELTQDGTAWIGPLIISSLILQYGYSDYQRIIAIVCAVQFGIGIPLLWMVNVVRGEDKRQTLDEEGEEGGQEAVGQERKPSMNPISNEEEEEEKAIENVEMQQIDEEKG